MSSPSPPAAEPGPALRALFQRRLDGDAERMNHWLAVLGENAALVTAALGRDGVATT
jgi:hypothetical protein